MTRGLLTLGAIPAISVDTPHYPEEREGGEERRERERRRVRYNTHTHNLHFVICTVATCVCVCVVYLSVCA